MDVDDRGWRQRSCGLLDDRGQLGWQEALPAFVLLLVHEACTAYM
jgi:hypothetical protein